MLIVNFCIFHFFPVGLNLIGHPKKIFFAPTKNTRTHAQTETRKHLPPAPTFKLRPPTRPHPKIAVILNC